MRSSPISSGRSPARVILSLAARSAWPAIQPATRWPAELVRRRPGEGPHRRPGRPRDLAAGVLATPAVGAVLGLAGHAVGWPIVRGGSQNRSAEPGVVFPLARRRGRHGLAGRDRSTSCRGPRDAARRHAAPGRPDRRASAPGRLCPAPGPLPLRRGAFKLDWALSGPIPWSSAACARAGTVHLGGPSRRSPPPSDGVGRGEHPDRPFVLLRSRASSIRRAPRRPAHGLGLLPRPQRLDGRT